MTTLRVKAIQPGYYGSVRRDPGDKKHGEFVLTSALHFSKSWMEPIGWDVEEEQAKEKAEASEPKAKTKTDPAPAKPVTTAPTPIKASTETTVTPPATAPKQVNPITGQDI